MTTSGTTADTRRPRRVFAAGSEPDPRFTFANERTFLAWIRTALGLFAAGVALDSFATGVEPPARLTMAVALIGLGFLCGVGSFMRWMANERALRESRPLPGFIWGPVLSVGVGIVGLLLAIGAAVGA